MKKIFALISFLLIPNLAFATALTVYVNTDCSDNGDGSASTCASGVGNPGAYTNVANAVTDLTTDFPSFVASTKTVTVNLRGATEDTSDPDLSGITTNVTYDITFTVDSTSRHDGKWNTSKYRLRNSNYYFVLSPRTAFVTIDGLQMSEDTNDDDSRQGCIGFRPESVQVRAFNIICRKTGTSTNVNQVHFNFNGGVPNDLGATAILVNSIAYDSYYSGVYCAATDNGKCIILNNTIIGSGVGGSGSGLDISFYGTNDIADVQNNIAYGSTSQDYWIEASPGTSTISHNVTEDSTSPDGATYQGTVLFSNAGSKDFRLSASDTMAKDRGNDLSADTYYPFSTDHVGATRPQGASWDIGANEYNSGGGGGGGGAVPAAIVANGIW